MARIACSGNHIMVGLGRLGGLVLKEFKMRMFEEFPTDEERNRHPVALLYVDSADEMMPKDGTPHPGFRVMGQDASFTNNEFLNIKTVDVERILEHIDHYPALKGIVEDVGNSKEASDAIGQLGLDYRHNRRANRLLFGASAVEYVNALHNAYSRCQSSSENTSEPYINIFAGLSDGTGSGTVIDAVVQARKAFPQAYIKVYALLLDTKSEYHPPQFRGNTYAALAELNALQAGRWSPCDVTGIGRADLYNYRIKGVADSVLICSNAGQNGLSLHPYSELPRVVSDFLFAQTFIPDCYDNEYLKRIMRFETMDGQACEYDETASADEYGSPPVARTKKLASFGIKRVVYPELRTDDDIKKFAHDLISQSGTLLNLNNDQLQLHLRNNEGWLSPDNPASRNRKVLYVSIPASDESVGLGKFADKLEDAIKNTFYQNEVHAELIVNRRGAFRKEILVLAYEYLFPMRAIEGIEVYKKWYDDTLQKHDPQTNAQRAVDIHTEMCCMALPSIMPVLEESSPSIKLYVAVGGNAYGPYTYEECRAFVAEQRIVPKSLVWMPDMPAWTEASQVPFLQELFQQICG